MSFEVITNHKDIRDAAIGGLKIPCERFSCGSLVSPKLASRRAGTYDLQSISACDKRVWPLETIAV